MERISQKPPGQSRSRRLCSKILLVVSVFALLSIGNAQAQVSDSTGALTVTPLIPTADCQGTLAYVVLNPYLITTFPFIPTYSFLTITGDLIFPPSPVSLTGYGGQSISQIIAVRSGTFASVTATVVGCYYILGFCYSTVLSTGVVYLAPEAPCGCQGLRVEASGEVLPINPGVATDTASTTITASVSNPAPAGGCEVTFSPPEPIVASGGHEHDGDRPHGTLTPTSCIIDEGMTSCAVQYTASEFSGTERILGRLTLTGEQAEGEVVVQVKNLLPLGTGASYRLTGETTDHPNNHHGTETTNRKTVVISDKYLAQTGTTLGINDMSLALGGGFDILAGWEADIRPPGCHVRGHCEHRDGRDADIDRCAQQTPDTLVKVCVTDRGSFEGSENVNDILLEELAAIENVTLRREGGVPPRLHLDFP